MKTFEATQNENSHLRANIERLNAELGYYKKIASDDTIPFYCTPSAAGPSDLEIPEDSSGQSSQRAAALETTISNNSSEIKPGSTDPLEFSFTGSPRQPEPEPDDYKMNMVGVKPEDRTQKGEAEIDGRQSKIDNNPNSRTTFGDTIEETGFSPQKYRDMNEFTRLEDGKGKSQVRLSHETAIPNTEGKQLLKPILPWGLAITSVPKPILTNRVQEYVENLTQESWDWWPLEPCHKGVKPGLVRIKWQCVSADQSSVHTLTI